MRFIDLRNDFQWVKYTDQIDSNVTYIYVLNDTVSRLRGDSDILYIGKTTQQIIDRFKQETSTRNTHKNTQNTNIRTTFIFEAFGLQNVSLYYVRSLSSTLNEAKSHSFLEALKIWDKKSYTHLADARGRALEVSLEKYLLVRYASDHLEVPPLNNRM